MSFIIGKKCEGVCDTSCVEVCQLIVFTDQLI